MKHRVKKAPELKIAIVVENASMRMGGEASLGFIYFAKMRQRGLDARLLCHERVRAELLASLPDEKERFVLIADSWCQILLARSSKWFPSRIRELIFDQLIQLSTQLRARSVLKKMATDRSVNIVFQPAPIAPRGVSCMYGLGLPVIIGPLCGGVDFPPGFRHLDSVFTRLSVGAGRLLAALLHPLFPGKRRADVVLVAHDMAERALPKRVCGRIERLIESGVDMSVWQSTGTEHGGGGQSNGTVRFVYSGRFADWKGITYLIRAFELLAAKGGPVQLDLIGGGGGSEAEVIAAARVLGERVRLHGWKSRAEAAAIIRECDVFVMPSLRECGGTAILEAMALGKPVVVTDWAGPAIYVNSSCGIRVPPDSEETFVQGLCEAMERLASSSELRKRLGEGGRRRVTEECFDWDDKTDRVVQILAEELSRRSVS